MGRARGEDTAAHLTIGSLEGMQSGFLAELVDMDEGGCVVFEELDELRLRTGKADRGLLCIKLAGVDHVESFGEEGWVVDVFGVAGDAAFRSSAGLPEVGAGIAQRNFEAYLKREGEAEAEERDALVVGDGAAFAGVGFDACGCVMEGDFGFDLVAVLAAGTAGAAFGEVALLEEGVVWEGGGVHWKIAKRKSQIANSEMRLAGG